SDRFSGRRAAGELGLGLLGCDMAGNSTQKLLENCGGSRLTRTQTQNQSPRRLAPGFHHPAWGLRPAHSTGRVVLVLALSTRPPRSGDRSLLAPWPWTFCCRCYLASTSRWLVSATHPVACLVRR